MQPLLNTEEAAKILGLSPQTLYAWRARKKKTVPYIKFETCVKYREVDLIKYVEDHLVQD